jgi:hypothetical protein
LCAKEQAEGRVHVERLGLGRIAGRSGGRIAHVPDSPVPDQIAHVPGPEHVAHQTRSLVEKEAPTFGRGNSGGILSAVLQHLKAIVEQLIDRGCRHHPYDSAHGINAYLKRILSATASGSHGLAATTAVSSGGANRESTHQGSRTTPVIPPTSTSTKAIATPLATPNKVPKNRSAGPNPAARSNSRRRNLSTAASNSTPTKISAKPAT